MAIDTEKTETEVSSKCMLEDEKDIDYYKNRCSEMEEKYKKSDYRCMDLQLEIEKRRSEHELLQTKFKDLEVEKLAMEDYVKILKRKNEELVEEIAACGRKGGVQGVVDLTGEKEDEDGALQIMIENKVLECEKKRAEDEVVVWKEIADKLKAQIILLEKENMVMRGGEHGELEPGVGLRVMDSHYGVKTLEMGKTKDGWEAQMRLDDMQFNRKAEESDRMLCATPGKGAEHSLSTGTPFNDTPYKNSMYAEEGRRGATSKSDLALGFHARKRLTYGNGGSLNQKLDPATPVSMRPCDVGLINISDSDDEPNTSKNPTTEISRLCSCTNLNLDGKGLTSENNSLKKTSSGQSSKEDLYGCEGSLPFRTTPKRRRASNIVTSDSESDNDEVPICKLIKITPQDPADDLVLSHLNNDKIHVISENSNVMKPVTTPRRRLVTRRQCNKEATKADRNASSHLNTAENEKHTAIPATENVIANDEIEDSGSDGEEESMGDFIVDDSDVSYMSNNSDVSESNDISGESESVSDGNMDYGEIISKLSRKRDSKLKWEFEAEMLSAFGKDPEVCMRAVCALYRQQTSDEKSVKGTIYSNQRGFSQCDATRGCILAEFLTDGDQHGDLMKSVKELKEFDPKGVEVCRNLATHYSKQLFAIYKNKEDPFFLPSCTESFVK